MTIAAEKRDEGFATAFAPVRFTVTDAESAEWTDVEVYRTTDGKRLGVKRFAAAESFTVNISNYLRRTLSPEPFVCTGCGVREVEGRTVAAYIAVGDEVSESGTFTASLSAVKPWEVLSAFGTGQRKIARGEWDEVAFMATPAKVTAEAELMGGEGESEKALCLELGEGMTVTGEKMVAVGINAGEIVSHAAVPEAVRGFRVRVKADGEERIAVEYGIVRHGRSAVRLCWLNGKGAFDYHTFGHTGRRRMEVEKERMESTEGCRTLSSRCRMHYTLSDGAHAEATAEAIAGAVASPRVYMVDSGGGFTAVDVLSERVTLMADGLEGMEIEVRLSAPETMQEF